ncbi:MAG: phosphoribosylformylglycinamidine synthase subunit PurS, partial [Dehalococcoidales bacterium]|nr:phosphoribosylformylglycinamidine synthase subunit PurS [Dehalococcoidales bacterium]
MHRIEVSLKASLTDVRGLGLTRDIEDLGIGTVTRVNVVDVYWLDANLTPAELALVCHSLLADPVIQDYAIVPTDALTTETAKQPHIIEVAYNAGVSDPVEDTIKKALRDLGISDVKGVKIAKQYLIYGRVSVEELETLCNRLLLNPIVQHVVQPGQPVFPQNPQYRFKLNLIDIFDRKNVTEVRKQFDFTDDEFQAIVTYYRKEGRVPTDAELETLFQTWSEHCVHKTFKGRINCGGTTINNLLKNTIIKATAELNKPWCLSVFEDNAGVIDFDGRWALCFKVETHNHPSAVEPYGGAATGIGGVIRDPLGTGLGAKPILNTDVFCFAPPDWPYERLPKGVLHPRRVFKGVRAGVADYANRLGIPTLNGAILFDERFIANPLVFCGTLGLLPRELSRRGQQQPGDLIVV